MAEKKDIKKLNFRFERRRVRKETVTDPICPDFKKDGLFSGCALSNKCKNATYKGEFSGSCYGGARETEIRHRQSYLEAK